MDTGVYRGRWLHWGRRLNICAIAGQKRGIVGSGKSNFKEKIDFQGEVVAATPVVVTRVR